MNIYHLQRDIAKYTTKPRAFHEALNNKFFTEINNCVSLKNPLVQMWFVNTVTLAVHYRLNGAPEPLFHVVGSISPVTERKKHPMNQGRFFRLINSLQEREPNHDMIFKYTDELLRAVKSYRKLFNFSSLPQYAKMLDAESFDRPTKLLGSFKYTVTQEFLNGQQNATY